MAGNTPTRRNLLGQSAAAAGALMAAGSAVAASSPPAPPPPAATKPGRSMRPAPRGEAGGAPAIAPFHAAVVRIPTLVPPTKDSLQDTRRKNTEAMLAAIETAQKSPNPPRLMVFSVLQLVSAQRAVSGVHIDEVAVDLMGDLTKSPFAPVLEACRKYGLYISTSTQEKSARMPGKYFHTGFIMGPEGLVLRSPKSQAQSAPEIFYIRDFADDYKKAFGPDSILPVAKTPLGNMACFIEGEAEVLEVTRMVTAKGAEIICHPSVEHDETPWRALKQATAYQNQVFMLTGATSRMIKPGDEGWTGGGATIMGPEGQVLAEINGRSEGVTSAVIDLKQIAHARKAHETKTTPAWNLYRDLYSQ